MGRAEVRTVILFEDKEQRTFIQNLVKRLGLRPERLVNCRNNAGVLQSLGEQVDALRERNFQKNLGLIVVIDADDATHVGRVKELLARIKSDCRRNEGRGEDERVALVVPAREIENWYVHLCVAESRPVDEGKDYKPTPEWRRLEKDLGAAARTAARAWEPEVGRLDPPSLVEARRELGRLT